MLSTLGFGALVLDAIPPEDAGDLVHRFVEEAERELDRLASLRSPAAR